MRRKLREESEELSPPADEAIPITRPYRVTLVDDHAVVRAGLRALLEAQPGIEVIAEADSSAPALQQVRQLRPDLAIVDLTLGDGPSGLELIPSIRKESPKTEVMVLTMHFSDELAREVLKSGALAFVLKSDAHSELLAAVDQIRRKQPFFTSQLAISMANNFMEKKPARNEPNLTERETEVVTLLSRGKSNKEVAARLNVSTRTVESHRCHIMRKMSFSTFSDMVRYAVRNNMVEP